MYILYFVLQKKLDFHVVVFFQELVEEIMYKNLVPMATGDESIDRILGKPLHAALQLMFYHSFSFEAIDKL